MRIPDLFHNADIVQFDVQELVHRLERALDRDVVLELHGDGVVH